MRHFHFYFVIIYNYTLSFVIVLLKSTIKYYFSTFYVRHQLTFRELIESGLIFICFFYIFLPLRYNRTFRTTHTRLDHSWWNCKCLVIWFFNHLKFKEPYYKSPPVYFCITRLGGKRFLRWLRANFPIVIVCTFKGQKCLPRWSAGKKCPKGWQGSVKKFTFFENLLWLKLQVPPGHTHLKG